MIFLTQKQIEVLRWERRPEEMLIMSAAVSMAAENPRSTP